MRGKADDELTERELAILRLRATGLNMKQSCDLLHITASTGRNHLSSAYSKLDVHTATQALRAARSLGLVE